jgi:hypothetical protein
MHIQKQNGKRNEFVHLCVILHQIWVDAGCFDAALVPLRAYSALIFEEHLRSLRHRYRTRLEKKSRSRKRYKVATSALPAILTNSRRVDRQQSAVSPSSHVAPISSHRSTSFTRSGVSTGSNSCISERRINISKPRQTLGEYGKSVSVQVDKANGKSIRNCAE